MVQYLLKEDKTLDKLEVRFSNEISSVIEDVEFYNKFETEALGQWHVFLNGMISWIANPVIAWDNQNKYQHDSDSTTHIKENGYDVTFVIKENEYTHETYVYVFELNIRYMDFGLRLPSLYEYKSSRNGFKKKYTITESQLRSIISEAIKQLLRA